MPDRTARQLNEAFDSATEALPALDQIFVANAAVNAAADDYRPAQRVVRNLQKDMRKIDAEIDDLNQRVRFQRTAEDSTRRDALEVRIERLAEERAEIAERIPESWQEKQKVFNELTRAEENARNTFRRAADDAIEAPAAFLAVLRSNEAFYALEDDLAGLREIIATGDPSVAEETVNGVSGMFREVEGASDVRSDLSKVSRALRGTTDREAALASYADAVSAYETQLEWRRDAEGQLTAGIETYVAALGDTIGARQQQRLNREQALYIAACNASHRDLSLNF